jgi:hypothetical protein
MEFLRFLLYFIIITLRFVIKFLVLIETFCEIKGYEILGVLLRFLLSLVSSILKLMVDLDSLIQCFLYGEEYIPELLVLIFSDCINVSIHIVVLVGIICLLRNTFRGK